MEIFNVSQKVTTKLFYNLLAQMTPEERRGAVLALTMLVPATEDGYLAINDAEVRTDFFLQCYDVLVGVMVALKLLSDDELVPYEPAPLKSHKIPQRLAEAEQGIDRLEQLLTRLIRSKDINN